MLNRTEEIEKISRYIAEVLQRQQKNPALAASERLFRMWEETCHPVPFSIPTQGIVVQNIVLVPSCEDGEPVERIGCLSWDAQDGCPVFSYEYPDRMVRQKFVFGDGCITMIPPEEIDTVMTDDSYGEHVEIMFDVVNILKRDYPNMNLQHASNALIMEALAELKKTHPGKVVSELYARRGKYKSLLNKVLNEMAEDEVSAQLTLPLEDVSKPAAEQGLLRKDDREESPPAVLPQRGAWEISCDLQLLCEAEEELLLCEDHCDISFQNAETILPLNGNQQVIRWKNPAEMIYPLREGSRLQLFQTAAPTIQLGTLTVDVLEETELIGTIEWEADMAVPVDCHLHGKPRKSPQSYIVRLAKTLSSTSQDKAMKGQDALRSMLGIIPLTYHYPRQAASADFPELDAQQACAVHACLDDENPVVLVQGPPGTGKTSVLEKVVRELAAQHKRILITAPSNTAIDNICLKLFDLPLLRHASARDSIHTDVAARCWSGDNDCLTAFRQKAQQCGCEIHAGTHIGILRSPIVAQEIVNHDLFDVIVFDEAGMSGATEVLPCSCLARRAFFFGDPKQLPPFPLPDSVWKVLKERHDMTASQRSFISGGFMGWLQTFRHFQPILLKTCYRCQNPRLMRFASQLFYDAQVVTNASADYYRLSYKDRQLKYPPETLKLVRMSALPQTIRNEQLKLEGFQPGYENAAEAVVAAWYVLHFLKRDVPLHEICMISPYRRQVRLIRSILQLNRPEDVTEDSWRNFTHDRISTVDSFQGGESDVVIVSYVRSGERGIGFVNDPNRVNVTHTRARRDMVVIGDIDHLQACGDNRLFLRMRRGFERDGLVETLSADVWKQIASSLQLPDGVEWIRNDGTADSNSSPPSSDTEEHRPVQLLLFE